MAIYSSSFTGQQIDQLLAQVDKKINIADIVDDEKVGSATTPASSRLMQGAYQAIASQADVLDNKVMRIDGSEQIVNGKKKFATQIEANGGMKIPTSKTLEIADIATLDTSAVNLKQLKQHGLSLDTPGAAISISTGASGYLRLDLNFNTLSALPEGTKPDTHVVMAGDTPYKVTDQLFRDAIYADQRFTNLSNSNSGKVDTTTFNNTVTQLNSSINQRVLITTYNQDLTATNNALAARVLTTTYDAKMTALDAADAARVLTTTYNAGMATKVDVTTYNAAISGINTSLAGKVDNSTYNTKMTALDGQISTINTSLGTKMDYAKSGTGTAAGGASTNLVTFAKKEVAMFVVSAVWTGVAKPAVFEVYMTNDGTTAFVDSRAIFAGSLTFTAALTGGNMVLQAVNGDATKTVTLSYKTLVQY
ncbi:putative tail fiber [Serratia phage phiMAM1]|uniref:Putative tail fiber n=1 Tax=Serratia phage phiMAM1 TaxID=1262513 RepID=K7Z9J3_9CAUD|nr:putative tail fiber [Serratia phage phiMAM1]AFX93498.1 putative tail fiber [Serratia phage phiMAM1]